MQVNIIQSTEGLNRTKKVKKGQICSLLEPGHPPSNLEHQYFWFLGLWTPTGTYTISSPGFQAFRFGLKLHHWLSWASILKMADHRTSSLHNCVSQSLTVSFFLYNYTYHVGSISVENLINAIALLKSFIYVMIFFLLFYLLLK